MSSHLIPKKCIHAQRTIHPIYPHSRISHQFSFVQACKLEYIAGCIWFWWFFLSGIISFVAYFFNSQSEYGNCAHSAQFVEYVGSVYFMDTFIAFAGMHIFNIFSYFSLYIFFFFINVKPQHFYMRKKKFWIWWSFLNNKCLFLIQKNRR